MESIFTSLFLCLIKFLRSKRIVKSKRIGIIVTLSHRIRKTTTPEAKKAPKAVKNQPPITLTTPATRYTALSLPQALSASEVPIATIKVTYVVDKGNFIAVAIEIKIPATIRLTDALIISKAGASTL